MTRCKHCSYNYQLKSSVYNQTGQAYEVQLAAYGAMTNHLRRILLAKSVVDSGKVDNRVFNKSNKNRRAKTSVSKTDTIAIKESPSRDLIDRLAYDSKHHPHKVASMNWRPNKCSCGNYNNSKKGVRSNSTDSSEDSSLRDHQGTLKNYRDEFRADTRSPNSRQRERGLNGLKKNHRTDFEECASNSAESDDFEDVQRFGKSDRREQRQASRIFRSVIPCGTSTSEISTPGTPEFVASTSNINPDRFYNDVSVYVKFVYDITKEVMDRGYYSDDEIERVFEKHLERNLGRLNKNKMLREINSLKKALNINYESGDEEDDDATPATSGFTLCSTRSLAKLRSSETSSKKTKQTIEEEAMRRRIFSEEMENKPETINPHKEIIVTKEDVLKTLLEMDLNPDKAQKICRSLQKRSKEVNLCEQNRKEEKEIRNESWDNKLDKNSKKQSDSYYDKKSSLESKLNSFSSFATISELKEESRKIESEKDETEGIKTNLDEDNRTEKSTESSKENFSISNERSAVLSIEEEINKLEFKSEDSINGEKRKSDKTSSARGSKETPKGNNDSESQEEQIPNPPSSSKLSGKSNSGETL